MFNDIKNIMKMSKQLKNLKTDDIDFSSMKEMMKQMGIDEELLNKQTDELFRYKHELKYIKIHPDAVTPKYNYETDSGFDFHSIEEVIIPEFGRALVKTGLKFELPKGSEMQVRPKSGLALKEGLTVLNTPGTVDEGYTGEIMVIVFNTNNKPYTIKKGMKIAQGVLCPVYNGKMVNLHEVVEIEERDRKDKGFGSTGI